jgi:hypothetical protein
LLTAHRGYRNKQAVPALTHEQILAWADAHHAAHGRWPTAKSGPIASAPGETWTGITMALEKGLRGFRRGMTLPRLLEQHRGRRNKTTLPKLTIEQILAWADAHHAVHGRWPIAKPVPIASAPGETWSSVASALAQGGRGLNPGMTLPGLLAQHRGRRNRRALPALTLDQIQAWAEQHHAAHGRWPTDKSGPITGAPGETWCGISKALAKGRRGLTGRTTLTRLLASRRRPVR